MQTKQRNNTARLYNSGVKQKQIKSEACNFNSASTTFPTGTCHFTGGQKDIKQIPAFTATHAEGCVGVPLATVSEAQPMQLVHTCCLMISPQQA